MARLKPEIEIGTEVKCTDREYHGLHGIVMFRGDTFAMVQFWWNLQGVYLGFLTTEVDPVEGRELITKGQKQYTACVEGLPPNPIESLKKVRWEWIQDLAATTSPKEADRLSNIVKKFDREIQTREDADRLGMSHYDYMVMLNEKERLTRIGDLA